MTNTRKKTHPVRRYLVALALLGGFALAAGCEEGEGGFDADDPEGLLADGAETGVAAEAVRHGRGFDGKRFDGKRGERRLEGRGGHRGPGAFLCRAALKDLELSDSQRAEVEKLVAAGRPVEGEARAADVGALRAERAKALNRLHGILTPGQRGQLVEKMRARRAERREEHRAAMDAFLTAFAGEAFDAASFAPPERPRS